MTKTFVGHTFILMGKNNAEGMMTGHVTLNTPSFPVTKKQYSWRSFLGGVIVGEQALATKILSEVFLATSCIPVIHAK